MNEAERTESIPVIREIFVADGTLAQQFIFSGAACYEYGVLEVATLSPNQPSGKWVDLPVDKWFTLTTFLGVQLQNGFRLSPGTRVRVTYLSPKAGAGGGTIEDPVTGVEARVTDGLSPDAAYPPESLNVAVTGSRREVLGSAALSMIGGASIAFTNIPLVNSKKIFMTVNNLVVYPQAPATGALVRVDFKTSLGGQPLYRYETYWFQNLSEQLVFECDAFGEYADITFTALGGGASAFYTITGVAV